MARIKIELPENELARIIIPARIADINYGNHLGNDSLISILHEARVQWLKKFGYSELNAAGSGLILTDLSVEYLAESFYGDTLSITVFAGEISRAGFELYYSVECSRNGKSIPVAKAKTGMLCYDYSHKKVISIPAALKEILQPGD